MSGPNKIFYYLYDIRRQKFWLIFSIPGEGGGSKRYGYFSYQILQNKQIRMPPLVLLHRRSQMNGAENENKIRICLTISTTKFTKKTPVIEYIVFIWLFGILVGNCIHSWTILFSIICLNLFVKLFVLMNDFINKNVLSSE